MKRREFLKAMAAATFLKHIPSAPGAPVVNTITFIPNYCQRLIMVKARHVGFTEANISLELATSAVHPQSDTGDIKWLKDTLTAV